MPTSWSAIEQAIGAATGEAFAVTQQQSVGGGSINQAYRLSDSNKTVFVKLNTAARLDMFEAEAEGLRALATSQSIRVPEVICLGEDGTQSFLVLEYLALRSKGSEQLLGQQLAAMHRCVQSQFGWSRHNTIGSTVQVNEPSNDWVSFWREQRVGFQYQLAKRNGYAHGLTGMDTLLDSLDYFFSGYQPLASMLHGDLWSGNYAFDEQGAPVIFDPAFYYGDRETDLAMTELFGGFGGEFYRSYEQAWPLDEGYPQRKVLYNLYHILNHVNLFGSGYLGQAQDMINTLLRWLKG